MIQQPELGKKIADYRKAKGLTQEELVEKCNLSVRTLQRIEAGEVAPRTYTVKLICEALEINYVNSFNGNKGLISKRLEQFYISFIDLFNLKTITMKKISILSIMTAAIIFGAFVVNNRLAAQNSNKETLQNDEVESSSKPELPFYDFSCHGCMGEKGSLIGRDVSFKLNGVEVKNIRLITIDEETREFNALFVKGQFLKRKVSIDYPEEYLIDGSLKYSADKIEKSDSKIILIGNAKVYDLNDKENPDDDESIETNEIIINLI